MSRNEHRDSCAAGIFVHSDIELCGRSETRSVHGHMRGLDFLRDGSNDDLAQVGVSRLKQREDDHVGNVDGLERSR